VAQRGLSFDPQPGLSEERPDQLRLVPKPSDGQVELLVQFLEVATHEVPHLHMFEVVPAPLVPRGEVRGITRQSVSMTDHSPWSGNCCRSSLPNLSNGQWVIKDSMVRSHACSTAGVHSPCWAQSVAPMSPPSRKSESASGSGQSKTRVCRKRSASSPDRLPV